jgi:hypothetical protein
LFSRVHELQTHTLIFLRAHKVTLKLPVSCEYLLVYLGVR